MTKVNFYLILNQIEENIDHILLSEITCINYYNQYCGRDRCEVVNTSDCSSSLRCGDSDLKDGQPEHVMHIKTEQVIAKRPRQPRCAHCRSSVSEEYTSITKRKLHETNDER